MLNITYCFNNFTTICISTPLDEETYFLPRNTKVFIQMDDNHIIVFHPIFSKNIMGMSDFAFFFWLNCQVFVNKEVPVDTIYMEDG